MSCQRFAQNAWKRDLCSNCFKGKEDHAPVVDNRARYLANLKEIIKRPPPPSILRGAVKKNIAAFKVHFPAEESQVIGYGGDDFSDCEDELDYDSEDIVKPIKIAEDPLEEEEYKKFQELTEFNTEFNKDLSNLTKDNISTKLIEGPKKAVNTPLKLGQVKSNSEGKKTILVSVQPFGSTANSTPLSVSRKTHLNNLLHDASDSLNVDGSAENKSTIISNIKQELKDENKTDVSSETDHCQRIHIQDNISTSDTPFVNNITVENQAQTNLNSDLKNQNTKEDEDGVEDKSKKTELLAESRLNSLIEGKKSQITRGTILTKSHEQAKTKRYFQLGPIKPDEDLSVSESLYKKLETNDKINSTIFSKAKDTISIKTSIQQKNSRNLTNGLFSSKLMKKEFGIQSDLELKKIKSIDYIETNKTAINQGAKEEYLSVSGKQDSVLSNPPVIFPKLLHVDNCVVRTEKDDVLLINGVPAESREMVGEPDGRADSDDLDEPPPDLPTTPPPLLLEHVPRPSFLHSIPRDKPKLPMKPNLREKSPPKELILDHAQLNATSVDPSLSPTSRHNLITKRQAPKPPPTPLGESPPKSCELYVQCPGSPSENSPTECRERASSCSPLPSDSSSNSSQTPEPTVTRRSLSLSNEALTCTTPPPVLDKKKGNKMKSTLRKFLRLASREEFKCEELGTPPLPPPRPRPEIIHPLDLNKSAVQVLRSDGSLIHTNKLETISPETPSSPTTSVAPSFHSRPSKPPPPPRSQSLDCALGLDSRPARPPPPSKDLLPSQRLSDPAINPSGAGHSVYVNLGEVRSAIAPVKPQRTASLREKDFDPLYQTPSAMQMADNLYESFAPECDSSREKSSLPYYGSETESDIYCPYTFANSQKGEEELRACKTRTVVHKSLEDNYGAVIVANHEALTQLLEQVNQVPQVPAALWPIKTCSNLQWTDFTVDSGGGEVVGGRVFLPAAWAQTPVTLCLTAGQARLPTCFLPVTQFFDLVASQYLQQDKTELVQVSVAVLVRQQFMTLQSFVTQLPSSTEVMRESALLILQVVNGLKILQAQGREEASLSQFVLSRDEHQFSPRVFLLPHEATKDDNVSLCECALKVIELLSLPQPLMAILRSVLNVERATSLTQAKSALELWLWGPTQVPVSADTQVSLQRWLDLERATVLQSLVVQRPSTLSCSDYCHLSFLVKTNAKIMADALSLLNQYPNNVPSSS